MKIIRIQLPTQGLIIVLLLIFGFIIESYCQNQYEYNATAEKAFSRAVQLFQNGNYSEALSIFDDLTHQEPLHQRVTAAYIMKGKSLQRLNRYNESAALLLNFTQRFPETNYIDDTHYNLGIDFLMLRRYDEAAKHFILCLNKTEVKTLSSLASSAFESIDEKTLMVNDLENIYESVEKSDAKDLVALKLAEKYMVAGNPKSASNLLDVIIDRIPKSRYRERAAGLKGRLTSTIHIKIGVLLPLLMNSGKSSIKSLSEEMLDGIMFALDEFKKRYKLLEGAVTLEVRDSENDSSVAVKWLDEFSSVSDIVAVIGPLHGSITKECAPIAERYGISLLTPTTAINGIASLGKHIFQVSPDYSNRGKAMAQYAVSELGLSTVSVLASSEAGGRAMSQSFVDEAIRLGAKVIAIETYEKGASDLSTQFNSLREAGLSIMSRKDWGQNHEIPVTSIQGLFIPIADPDEISIIASQLRYFNIETQILGSNEWYDLSRLEANRRYVGGVIFTSNTFADEMDPLYIEFTKTFINQRKKYPKRYTMIGYDIMELLLTQINRGAITRVIMREYLSNISDYSGLQSKISFINGRVNSEIQILKYSNSKITRISEITVK